VFSSRGTNEGEKRGKNCSHQLGGKKSEIAHSSRVCATEPRRQGKEGEGVQLLLALRVGEGKIRLFASVG